MVCWLLVISVAAVAFSGVPGLLLSRRSALGQWIAAVLSVGGAAVAIAALVVHFVHPESSDALRFEWALPMGAFAIGVDDIGAIFLVPMFLIPALGSCYGLGYWPQRRHVGNGRKLRLCWGLLTAGMSMVVLARDGVLLLVAWEVMALAAFFLVCTEERNLDARDAAWVYLVATHVGTLSLFGFFALLRYATGSFDLWPGGLAGISVNVATGLFVLGVVGFGLKAGIMPLHVWLPGAHANAPSHVSAVMSGVLLKAGVYGLVRVAGLVQGPPVWWGGTLLVAGTVSAVLGIAFAAGQRDLKRLLAYSSIENVGIMVMGIGLATLGRAMGRGDWVVLGLGGSLLHVLNHGLFKPLLFLGAGSVVHAGHTRQMDLLGGLGKRMPGTFVVFVIGAVAICGLPPLNGFVSELILYIGLFKTVVAGGRGWIGLAAPALAVVGAMAVVSFVKVVGTVFAGSARSARAEGAHDPGVAMLGPMWVLAGCCLVIGVFPGAVVGVLDRAVAGWTGQSTEGVAAFLPMGYLTMISLWLVGAVAMGIWLFVRAAANRESRTAGTWDCGYVRPTARMQYTGSSFLQMLVELLGWVLWPKERRPRVRGVFPGAAGFASDVPDVVLDRGLRPGFTLAERAAGRMRVFQRGPIQVYLLYVLAILVLLLLFA
jgi:hydrogenase-4 component B